MTRLRIGAKFLSAALLALGLPLVQANAHHGFSGAYDATAPLYIEGRVQNVILSYPHVEMTVEVAETAEIPADLPDIENLGIDDVPGIITVVEPGSYELQIAGTEFVSLLDGRIAEGDRIALVALRNCLPPHEYRSRWIRLASGDVVSNSGPTQAEVQGCEGE